MRKVSTIRIFKNIRLRRYRKTRDPAIIVGRDQKLKQKQIIS